MDTQQPQYTVYISVFHTLDVYTETSAQRKDGELDYTTNLTILCASLK